MIKESIFRAYDIRGIYPEEINEEIAYQIGRFFVEKTKFKKIAIGRDMRISSPALFSSFCEGMIKSGVDVYDIGEVPTECLYFATVKRRCDAGVMTTASHNPKEYNGFKLVKRDGKTVKFIRGTDLSDATHADGAKDGGNKGEIRKIDIWQEYLAHIFSFVDFKKIKPFKIVVDAGNGMAGKVIPLMEKNLPVEIIPLNFKLDGNFPAHSSNPLDPESQTQINQEIKKTGADFGFIFDGDADRIFLIDELGNLIKGDIALLLLAKHFLKKYSGKGVAYNLICSKAVPKFIKEWGGAPLKSSVGAVNIMKKISENDAILGGEVSGHFSFRDSFASDSGFIAFLILLQIISESKKKVSEIVSEFAIYIKESEINFKVEDKEKILAKVKEKFSDGTQDYLDGVTVEYGNWWFNIRPSNTEPLLRLTIEADTKEIFEEKKQELLKFLEENQ